ncbi:hypothetical protein PGB90_005251 [Kerria lacca]
MGNENIVKDNNEETPECNLFFNGELFNEEVTQVDVYSDISSELESFHEILNDFNDYEVVSHLSSENLDDFMNVKQEIFSEVNENFVNSLKAIKSNNSKNHFNVGKKKARRLENARQLDLLIGEISDEYDDINDFMPTNCCFRFSQILEDQELTNIILDSTYNNFEENEVLELHSSNKRKVKENSFKPKKLSAHTAFNNLNSSERDFFRRRNLPMGMIQYLDMCVFSFFEKNPTGTYMSEPLSSYERMMLHCIAHYYELNSFSCNINNYNNYKLRFTKITNNFNYFNPPHLCLSQYLEQQPIKKVQKFKKEVKGCAFRI